MTVIHIFTCSSTHLVVDAVEYFQVVLRRVPSHPAGQTGLRERKRQDSNLRWFPTPG
jgi:hypothetical protein